MKCVKTLIAAAAMSLLMTISALAGQWQQDTTGWWYQNENGTYPTGWTWIDDNHDGTEKCYYFNENGYCLMNTVTPDGCTVDASGAWTVNGAVQTRSSAQQETAVTQSAEQTSNQASVSGTPGAYDLKTVWLSATGSKYHTINHCGKMNPAKAVQVSLEEAIKQGKEPCDKCFN